MPPGQGGGGVKLPSIGKQGAHGGGGNERGGSRRGRDTDRERKGLVLDGRLLVQKEQALKFSHCSPKQIIEMSGYLGVDPAREFYLLPVVRRAVVAPFPDDWAVGVDRVGVQYCYNKYTMRVINSHPLSERFIDWIAESRLRKAEENELRRKDAQEEEHEDDMGTPWMRFEVEGGEGVCYWYNFTGCTSGKGKLYTELQYKHILELELEERAQQATKAQQKTDPNKQAEMEHQLKLKKVTEKFFASGLRKFWLRWQLAITEQREKQAKALVKSGMVAGRQEAKGFRQWKEKAEQLAFVRRAMAPWQPGGRRDKQIQRDYFKMWREYIEEALLEKKSENVLRDYFKMWKTSCGKKRHEKKVMEIIRAMILGNALSQIFGLWKSLWMDNKDREALVLGEACKKIQRKFRERMKHRKESRVAVNQRKQIKYRLLRVCEMQETTEDLAEGIQRIPSDPNFKPEESVTEESGSLAVFLLEGAMQKAQDETEKARLRNVVRVAKSKSSVEPNEEGYGIETVRDDIYRIVDILDPIDRVKLRSKIESVSARNDILEEGDDSDSISEEDEEDEELEEDVKSAGKKTARTRERELRAKIGPGKLSELGTAVDSLIGKITQTASNPDHVQEQQVSGPCHIRHTSCSKNVLRVPAPSPDHRNDMFLSIQTLDAYERKLLNESEGSRLHQVAEKTRKFIDQVW